MTLSNDTRQKLKIAFVHPDLGIGGAERLVIDAAVGVQAKGHEVVIYTSHHDPKHCFEETRDGTLEVRVHGDSLPRGIFGKMYIVFAILRQLVLVLWLLWHERDTYDILFVDQLSACLPLLNWFSDARILFYCHFPDKLLSLPGSRWKRIYRRLFDWLEERTTAMADTIVVNSEFTAGMFRRAFPSVLKKPRVLYPPINLDAYDHPVNLDEPSVIILESPLHTMLSINRFERKKNVELALRAFVQLRELVTKKEFDRLRLVLAGGYDHRVVENVAYLQELDTLAQTSGLNTFTIRPGQLERPPADAQVVFVCSFNDAQRTFLLAHSELLLYTPSNEHFGITPVEAMYASLPVIAANSGGPLESVKHNETGLLLPPEPLVWANGMQAFIQHKHDGKAMGRRGREHVKAQFSLDTFSDQLEDILEELAGGGRPTRHSYDNVEYGARVVVAAVIVYAWYRYWFT